jgi:hypothetical protein
MLNNNKTGKDLIHLALVINGTIMVIYFQLLLCQLQNKHEFNFKFLFLRININIVNDDCILWKIAIVTPVYKGSGPKNNFENYRPISVISPIAKVFESLLALQMRKYFEEFNILSDSQHGFREKRACESALNTMVDY